MRWDRIKGSARQEWDKFSGNRQGEIGKKPDHPADKILETQDIYQREVEKHIAAWHARQKKIERTK